ncbi:Co-chaperone Hsc20 [Cadophora sp. DSE1049]|nr:Co-chaperone Hsc20 [Cadophora sp. DSE1049]
MRSTLSFRRLLVRNTKPNRNFTTALPRTAQLPVPICQACSRKVSSSNTRPRSQRRWQTTSSTSPAPNADDTIKSNPIPQTHYEFFPKTLPSGPPPSGPFHIDVRELRREFLQLQSIAHPDRHPQHLKTRAEATSARINEAYKTLQNPLLRAQYLLGLRGIDVAEDETAKVDDPELLMEVLDAREEIENARAEEELEEMRRVNEERIEESEGVLDRAFRGDDLGAAKEEAVRLRYWVNIRESLDAWERGKPVVLVH